MSKNICIIEDNKPVRQLLCILLKKVGFYINEFEDGASAFKWLQENNPDAVIMDILLPDYNGVELLKEIRKLPYGNLPVIAVTGFALPEEKDKYLNFGFDSYIVKPINISTFGDEIKSIINNETYTLRN